MPGSRPDLIAYVVDKKKEDDTKGFWREVGAAWRHQSGDGLTLKIHKQLSVAGDIVCVPRREQETERPAETSKLRAASPRR